jgi:hypothetical protein
LDTNVISELRKLGDGRADANTTAWLAARDAISFLTSVIALMELERCLDRCDVVAPRHVGLPRNVADLVPTAVPLTDLLGHRINFLRDKT